MARATAVTLATLALLLATAAVAQETARGEETASPQSTLPDIRALEIRSDVRYRYARTEIYSRVANPANVSQEVTFKAVLPDAAFISGFAITSGGRVFQSRVESRQQARAEYARAVSAGRTAAHVEMSARHANRVAVAVHVAAREKVAFNLTYEQLLVRERGRYRLRLMLDPGQPVQRLLAEVRIRDAANLTMVRVANLRASDNEVEQEEPDDPFAAVQHVSPGEALVRWEPDEAAQQSLAGSDGAGLRGLLEVQYDVARSSNATELVVGDGGYFVHFFAPPEDALPLLPKHVVFLLDTSSSMFGRKMEQLKEAMAAILSELRASDTFSLLTFASRTSVWSPARGLEPLAGEPNMPADAVVSASAVNITLAKDAVRDFQAGGWTYMHHALLTAYAAVRAGRTDEGRQSLVFFLTDGEPNGPQSSHAQLEALVAGAADPAPLYGLAFGRGADFAFLKRLTLRGRGFARKVYEAADAALQLRNLYRTVSSPLLANVTFRYADDQVEAASLTQTAFPVHQAGGELAVAGRMAPGAAGAAQELQAKVVGDASGATALETPAAVLRLPPQQAGFVERLWAYLTVRQLLERGHGDDQEAQTRARQLALQYSFVTPLTSLVVVKPDNASTTADLRDAAAASTASAAAAPYSQRDASFYSRAIPLGGGFSGRHRSTVLDSGRPMARGFGGSRPNMPGRSSIRYRTMTQSQSRVSVSNQSSPDLHLVPLSSLQWLNGSSANGTHYFSTQGNVTQALVVAEPTGAESVLTASARNCTATLNGSPLMGRCLPLPRCALQVFAASAEAFLPFFCSIGQYVGACCPETIVAAIVQQAQQAQQT